MGPRIIAAGLALALLLGASGCGQGGPKLSPVRGTVYYRGAPLPGGTIVFTPDSRRGNRGAMAQAEVRPDGTYVLRTGGDVGAAPGWHRISIAAGQPASLPPRYCDPDLSGQAREVEPGLANVIDLHLD